MQVHDPAAALADRLSDAVRVVVTGGAGFIGSHVVDKLVDVGADVVSIDSLHPLAHTQEPEYLNPAAEYVWADLRDGESLGWIVSGADAVCHEASMVGIESSFGDVTEYVDHNDKATASLLQALFRTGFRGPLVLASSMVVYGEGAYRCDSHGEVRPGPRSVARMSSGQFEPDCPRCGGPMSSIPLTEDAITDPRSIYAATKLHQEHLCASFMRETGAAVTALRYHNVYGPRMPQNSSYAGVAAIFRSALEAGRSPQVFEDGAQMRDFVHVSDVAAATVVAVGAATPGAFNIATGTGISIRRMAALLAAGSGADATPQVTAEFRAGDVRHILGSPRRAADVLGWRAEIGLEAGMKQFATDPLRNRDRERTK